MEVRTKKRSLKHNGVQLEMDLTDRILVREHNMKKETHIRHNIIKPKIDFFCLIKGLIGSLMEMFLLIFQIPFRCFRTRLGVRWHKALCHVIGYKM